jgi:hypothetical protein
LPQILLISNYPHPLFLTSSPRGAYLVSVGVEERIMGSWIVDTETGGSAWTEQTSEWNILCTCCTLRRSGKERKDKVCGLFGMYCVLRKGVCTGKGAIERLALDVREYLEVRL